MKTDDILNDTVVFSAQPRHHEPEHAPDHEVQMARSDLYRAGKSAMELHKMLKQISEQQGLEGWVQAKITKAADYLESVYHYLDYEIKSGELDEATPMTTPGIAPTTTVAAAAPGAPATTTAAPPAQAAVAAAAAAKRKKDLQAQVKQMQDAIKQAETNLISQKKQLTDLQKQMNQPMMEFGSAGASVAGGVASVANGMGKKKKDVGTLFGGTYKQDESEKLDEMPPVRSIRRAHRSWVDQKKAQDRRTHGFVKSYKDTDVGPSKDEQQSDLEKAMQDFMNRGGVVKRPPGKVINVKEEEKAGLYANVHAKRERIKHGSGEHMRKPGTKGAPTAQAWKDAAKTAKEDISDVYDKDYPVREGWKSAAAGAAMLGLGAMGLGGDAHAADMNKAGYNTSSAPAVAQQVVQKDGSSFPTDAPVGTKFGSYKDASGRTINKYVGHDLTTHFKPDDEGEWIPQDFPTNAPVGTMYGSFVNKDGVKMNKYVGHDLTPVFRPASEGPRKPKATNERKGTRLS